MSDELTRAEHYRREASRLYSLAESAEQSPTSRAEFFRMARMYEALSLQADSSERRGMNPVTQFTVHLRSGAGDD